MGVKEVSADYVTEQDAGCPVGYKQTEVGVIPENWALHDLQDICRSSITYGIVQCGPHIENGVPYIRVSDMNARELDVSSMLCTTPAIAASFARSRVEDGDIVYALRGKLGEVRLIRNSVSGANLTQGTARIAPKNSVVGEYVLWQLRSACALKQAGLEAKGSTFVEITLKDLREVKIPLAATRSEQEAIAKALSDTDALIESLEQLISKKRHIKQGAMQELLTGKRRLPGFCGEWEYVPMNSLGRVYGGLSGKTKANFGHGSCRYIPFMNVMSSTVIDSLWLEKVDIAPNESQQLVMKGDLFFNGSSETPEEVGFCAVLLDEIESLYLNSFCFGFRLSAVTNGLFLAYWFRCREGRKAMAILAQGATRYNLSKRTFIKLHVPQPSVEEQEAIAAVLSDMDAGISAHETKLAKIRQLKQGMMHELLTGRIRLV